MAHSLCPRGHSMWNGNGKSTVWVYRVDFFREYMRLHPDFLLNTSQNGNKYGFHIYDCTEKYPREDLDCWYCEKCGCLTVYYSHYRTDFEPCDITDITFDDTVGWEEYIAIPDDKFDAFQDFYTGKNPVQAIKEYPFESRYRLSKDGAYAVGYNNERHIISGFKKIMHSDLDNL